MGRVHSIDDYLEAIYFLATPVGEYGPVVKEAPVPAARVAEMLSVTPPTASEMMKRLESEGLVERGPRKGPLLTKRGRAEAERVVRHHRIIERFLTDFMGYTAAESHVHADELGDAFTDEMVERLARAARQPRPLPARLAGRHLARAGGEPRPAGRSRRSPRARRASCAWPSTTATSCTGSTSRAWCPAPSVEVLRIDPAAGQLTVRDRRRRAGHRRARGRRSVRPARIERPPLPLERAAR